MKTDPNAKPFIDPTKVDPKLKIVKDEILEVLKKHDIAGTFCLTSATHGEFFGHFPTWSIFKLGEGQALHIVHKGSIEDKEGRVLASAHLVQSTLESLQIMTGNYSMILRELEKHMIVENKGSVAERFQPEIMVD